MMLVAFSLFAQSNSNSRAPAQSPNQLTPNIATWFPDNVTYSNLAPASGANFNLAYPPSPITFNATAANNNSYSQWQYAQCNVSTAAGSTYTTGNSTGTYNATYSFTNDVVGGTDAAFGVGGGSMAVVASVAGHSMVLQGPNGQLLYQNFANPQTTGTISLWWYSNPVTGGNPLYIADASALGGKLITYLTVSGGNFVYYYTTNSSGTIMLAAASATWYYISVDFNTAGNGQVNVTINGVRYITNVYKSNTAAAAAVSCGDAPVAATYIDALDYSWDAPGNGGYFAGRAATMSLSASISIAQAGSYQYQWTLTEANGTATTSALTPFAVLNPFPSVSNDSILYACTPYTFGQQWPYAFYNNLSAVNLVIVYPNGANRYFPGTVAVSGGIATLTTIMAINITGNFAFYYVNATTFTTIFGETTFTVNPDCNLVSSAATDTTWTFTTGTATTTDYTANFSTVGWSSTDYSTFIAWQNVAGDSQTSQSNPTTNYGTSIGIRTGGGLAGLDVMRGYIDAGNPTGSPTYLTSNSTAGQILKIYCIHNNIADTLYATTSFAELTITWNTQPATGATISAQTPSTGWNQFNIGTQYVVFANDTALNYNDYYSKEGANIPQSGILMSKFYHAANNIYAQTDASESITLTSPTASTTLNAGETITLTYATTDTNQRTLQFYNGATPVGSPILLGTSTGAQVSATTIASALTFDHCTISSTFSAASYLQITSLTATHSTFASSVSVTLSPFEDRFTSITPGTYNYTVYQPVQLPGGQIGTSLVSNVTNFVIAANQLNTIQCILFQGAGTAITLTDLSGNALQFNQFKVNATYVVNNGTQSNILTGNIFYADVDSNFTLGISDWFGNSLRNYTSYPNFFVNTQNPYMNVTIALYAFTIENLMRNATQFTLTTVAGYSLQQYITSGETLNVMLLPSNYTLAYTQTETSTPISIVLNINNAYLYVINSSYYSVYFSAFANDLLGIPQDSVRLYVNSTRMAWGAISLLSDPHLVIVKDFFNDTIFNSTLYLNSTSEYNIFVNMVTLTLFNNLTGDYLSFNITKNGTMLLSQLVAPTNSLSFRFTNGTYVISAYFSNGTFYVNQTVTLSANSSQLCSFGVNAPIPPDYSPVYSSQLYQYAGFKNLVNWSTDLVADYALFYPLQIVNYLNDSVTVYFYYLGQVMAINVNPGDYYAATKYQFPIYMPVGTTYRMANSTQFLNATNEPLASNYNSTTGFATLTFGLFGGSIQLPENAPIPWYMDVLLPFAVIGGILIIIAVVAVKRKKTSAGEQR